jgi:outer membrane protein assembly factor BamB
MQARLTAEALCARPGDGLPTTKDSKIPPTTLQKEQTGTDMKRRGILTVILIASASLTSFAQVQEKWTADLDGNLTWQKVTLSGSYLVATSNGLYAYDQENGQRLWDNKTFAGYAEGDVDELQGSPLLIAKKGGNVSIFDPFDGSLKFNSANAGVSNLKKERFLHRANAIFIAGDDDSGGPVIMVVDNNTGDVRWKLNEKFGNIVSVNEVSGDEFILTTLFYLYKLNSNTGDIVWKKSTTRGSEGLEGTALAGMLQGLANEMTKDMEFTIRYYQDLEKDVLVIASENKEERTGSDGKVSVSYSNSYNAFKVSDGSLIWDKPVEFKGKLGDLAFHGNGVIILPDDGNRTRINYHEFSSDGSGKWGKKGSGTVVKGGVYDHVRTGGNILLVSGGGKNSFLDLLDPATGELKYDKPVKISGQLARTIMSDRGIVYITTEEMNILDPSNGAQLLSNSIPTAPGLTVLDDATLYVFDTKSATLKTVNINNAEVKDITREKLKFEGKEEPTAIEKRGDGILVTSDQNLAHYTMDGTEKFRKYYKAPRESGLKRALLMAQAARAAYIGANAYVAAGALQSVTAEAKAENPVAGAMVEGLGMAYQELGDQASEFAKKSFQQAKARFSATSQGRDFNILIAEGDKGNSIERVNKNTGDSDATIDLGKEKEPKYAVDDVTGRVFMLQGPSKVVCYQF